MGKHAKQLSNWSKRLFDLLKAFIKALTYCVRAGKPLIWLCICAASSEPLVLSYEISTETYELAHNGFTYAQIATYCVSVDNYTVFGI